MAISEDFAVVSAVNDGDSDPNDSLQTDGAGAVYVFGRDVGGQNHWGEMFKLTAPDPALNEFFGAAIGLDGNTLVVGAPGKGVAGTAFIFELPQVGEPIELLRYPKTVYAAIDDDSDLVFDDRGDTTSDRTLQNSGTVGELDSATANRVNRLVSKFELPPVPVSKPRLGRATLTTLPGGRRGTTGRSRVIVSQP